MGNVSRGARFARFVGLAAAVVVALFAVGFLPTRRLAGSAAIGAMVVGGLISFVGAALAGWLLVAVDAETPAAKMQRSFVAMVARLAVVVVMGVAAALSGAVASTPLLFWLATTYVVLLPLEVRLAIASE